MIKRHRLAVAISILFASFMVVQPAAAAGTLVDCLKTETVCVSDGTNISNKDAVAQSLSGKAKVAVVPYDETLNASSFATQLAKESGQKELILVIDMSTDRFGVHSDSGKATEVSTVLNKSGESDGGEAIIAAQLGTIYETTASNDANSSSGGLPLPLVIVGVILLACIVSVVVGIKVKRKTSPSGAYLSSKKNKAEPQKLPTAVMSEDMKKELAIVSNMIHEYTDNQVCLNEAAELLRPIHTHIYQLFSRIDKKKAGNSREIAQVRYLDTLRKINSTLGKDYFEDIVRNPNLWDDSHNKIVSVLDMLKSVDEQIIENIKQVNSSKEIEFLINLDLLNSSKAIQVEDAFGRTKDATNKTKDDSY